ncbi:MAG: DNA polymerase III subunit delta [Candidatus Nomurabacteria bacterium]|jgi:DNA polymerase III delta subunit|nr:DNA polymerase III subunit delta [Candidatus Nomurabacteria bacterium]
MIKVLFGENSFELERALKRTVAEFGAEPERVNGDNLARHDLTNMLQGSTLFAERRLVIIRHLSDNSAVWDGLAEIGEADNDVVLVEHKLDKRSRVYKNLQKVADLQEFTSFESRDFYKVQQWTAQEATALGLNLNKKVIRYLTEVVGQDQWRLAQALDKLSLLGDVDITTAIIDENIEKGAEHDAFGIFEAAMRGKLKSAIHTLDGLEQTEDVYRLFGLLTSQAFNLAALVFSKQAPVTVAAELGVSPYSLGGLKKFSDDVTKQKMRKVLKLFNQADQELKTTSLDSWLVVKNLITKIAKL